MAYTARCEHSDLLTDMGSAPARPERAAEPVPPGSARAFVAAHAEALLARQMRSVPVKRASAASSSSWKRRS
jgi:hypothetical protein